MSRGNMLVNLSQKAIVLRDYQKAALTALWGYWYNNEGVSPLIVAPTGAGKSILIAEIIRQVLKAAPNAHIMMASHVKELLLQDMNELIDLAPETFDHIGICSAGLGQKETHLPVTFAGVQTAYKQDFPKQNLLIIDEAHLISRNGASMYGQLIANLKKKNPALRIAGLTATPYRMDSGKLTEGDDALFDGIAYDIELKTLIDGGYLVPPITKHIADYDNLTIRAGEYTTESQEYELQHHMQDYAKIIANETEEDSTLLFFPSVRTAETFSEYLNEHGLNADYVSGDMIEADRTRIIESFKSGDLTHLCNVNLMTTGSNIPHITAIVLMRATRSAALYVQMIGRGLRLHPESDKANCRVLDFGGNAVRHGPLNKPFSFNRDRSKSGLPVGRKCPECNEVMPVRQKVCDSCGHEIEIQERENNPKTTGGQYVGDLVGYAEQPHWVRCYGMHAQPWTSKAGNAMMRINYELAGHRWAVAEWLNPEGLDRTLLRRKWQKRAFSLRLDNADQLDITQAIKAIGEVNIPSYVKIARKDESKYYDVFDLSYDEGLDASLDDDMDEF